MQRLTERHIQGFDIKAFMLPTAIMLGVTGVSRAGSLVLDIQNGKVKLGFEVDAGVPVHRLEVWERIRTRAGPESTAADPAAPTAS